MPVMVRVNLVTRWVAMTDQNLPAHRAFRKVLIGYRYQLWRWYVKRRCTLMVQWPRFSSKYQRHVKPFTALAFEQLLNARSSI